MSEFGQSNPALPQLYLDQTERTFTKSGFISHFVRALETVGMIGMRGVWPYDPTATIENSAIVEGDVHVFPFDYPDATTFTVNSILYRPCIALVAYYGDLNSGSVNTENNQVVSLHHCFRVDGVFDLATGFWNARRLRDPGEANFGFGAHGDNHPTLFPDTEGQFVLFHNWAPFTGHGFSDVNLLSVKYWFTYLGPAGLWNFIGTGPAEGQITQHMSCGFAFGGGRIPGRGIAPDVNINRINPVFDLSLKAEGTGGDQYDLSVNLWRSLILGMQFGSKSTITEPVRVDLYNLENTELPFFPNYGPQTVPSPRVVTGGGGAHILGRIIVIPTETEDDSGDFYGEIVPEVRSDGVQPNFGQVFTCPGLRFCDRSAPLGVREDPITLDDWYMVPAEAAAMRLGLLFENGVTLSALELVLFTLTATDSYTMAGPGGDGFTFPNLGGGLPAPTVVVTGDAASAVDWDDTLNESTTPPDSDDQMVAVINSAGGSNRESECTWTITVDSGDPIDTQYSVRFSARNKVDATTEDTNPLFFEVFEFGSWVRKLTLDSAGDNAAHASFVYQVFTFSALLDSTAPSGTRRIVCRWNANKIGSLNGNTIVVKEVQVLHHRYL